MVNSASTGEKKARNTVMSEPNVEEERSGNGYAEGDPSVNLNEEEGGDNVAENNSDVPEAREQPESNNEEINEGPCIGGSNCSTDKDQLNDARCNESMPTSESNKENCNSLNIPIVTNEDIVNELERSDLIPLSELLKIHPKQLVSGFEYGEVIKRRAQENMKTARDKNIAENRKSTEMTELIKEDDCDEVDDPCCSKTISEKDHKTPHSYKRKRISADQLQKTSSSDVEFHKTTRGIPSCLVDHPDCVEVWVYMIYKEEAAHNMRNSRLFNDFKSVTPRMRAILLDWLMEVSEVYHLRRVTYYLSVDYFDRFLSIRPDIPKSLLQLVGITCLYIAAKVEEIYPPNLSEFSYVCDGACKAEEMVACELLILNSLGWEVILTTPSDWLNLYMQLHHRSQDIIRTSLNMDFNKDFLFPQYSAYQFTRASQLMDLLSLDPGFLKFNYSTIAAAAMYYMYDKETTLAVSGLTWDQMESCVQYMEVFHKIVKDAPDPRLHSCLGGPHPDDANRVSTGLLGKMKNGSNNENYSFQTHVASMEYFEKATIYRLSKLSEAKIQSNYIDDKKSPSKTVLTNFTSDVEEVASAEEKNYSHVSYADDLSYLEDTDCGSLLESFTVNESQELKSPEDKTEDLLSIDDIFNLLQQTESKDSDGI